MRRKVNWLGKEVGYLYVISEAPNKSEEVMWRCQCACGKEVIKPARDLSRKRSLSCGCKHGNRKYDRQISSAADIFRTNYKDSDMRVDEFVEMSQKNCFYCDSSPSNKYTGQCGDEFIYNGLDRIDSSLPHIKSNCVPCCRTCNIMKSDLSVSDFLKHIKKIITKQAANHIA